MYNLEETITKIFDKLEKEHNAKWTKTGSGTKEQLIKAFSQREVSVQEFLGFTTSSGLYRVMSRAVPSLSSIKPRNVRWHNFLLYYDNKFYCNICNKVLDIENRVSSKKISNKCKSCSGLKTKSTRKQLYEYLKTKECKECKITNPVVLEFHHLSDKEYNISDMMSHSWEAILLEINKCEILCANCHKIKTAKQQKWYEF